MNRKRARSSHTNWGMQEAGGNKRTVKLESAATKQRVALTSGSYVINRLATSNQPKNSGFTMDFRVLNSGVPEGATRNRRFLDCLFGGF